MTDDLDDRLPEHPRDDLDARRREPIRPTSYQTPGRAPPRRRRGVWSRALLPVLLFIVTAVLLGWVVLKAGQLLPGG